MFSLLPDDLESVTARAIHKVPRLNSSPSKWWNRPVLMDFLLGRHKSLICAEEMWTTTIKGIHHVEFWGKDCRGNRLTCHVKKHCPLVYVSRIMLLRYKVEMMVLRWTCLSVINEWDRNFPGLTQESMKATIMWFKKQTKHKTQQVSRSLDLFVTDFTESAFGLIVQYLRPEFISRPNPGLSLLKGSVGSIWLPSKCVHKNTR